MSPGPSPPTISWRGCGRLRRPDLASSLASPWRHLRHPGQGQMLHVGSVHLRQCAVALAGVIAVVGRPGILQRFQSSAGATPLPWPSRRAARAERSGIRVSSFISRSPGRQLRHECLCRCIAAGGRGEPSSDRARPPSAASPSRRKRALRSVGQLDGDQEVVDSHQPAFHASPGRRSDADHYRASIRRARR